jgi:hypothetical protein
MLLFKDGQLQDAQAWMARAQELDAYHINAELRDRNDQLNQVWMGYQRQVGVLIDERTLHTSFLLQLIIFLSLLVFLRA